MKIDTRAARAVGLSGAFLLLFVAGDASAQGTGAAALAVPAQSPAASASSHALGDGDHEFGVWGGGSLDSPTLWGKYEDAKFGKVGLRYAYVLWTNDALALKYTVDAVPVAVLNYERFVFVSGTGALGSLALRRDRKTVYGAGLAPVGFQLNVRRRERVQPFLQASGGFLYFPEDVPEARSLVEPNRHGAQFNFTADFGGGVQVLTDGRRALTVGYRYHHLSNWYRAPFNPGFDANLFYAGFSFFK